MCLCMGFATTDLSTFKPAAIEQLASVKQAAQFLVQRHVKTIEQLLKVSHFLIT